MRLTADVVKKMGMGKVFKDNSARINALDFYKDGDYLVTSSDDESLNVYNTMTGSKSKTIYCKKVGTLNQACKSHST